MSNLVASPTADAEIIQRAVFMHLFAQVNDAYESSNAQWAESDAEVAVLRGLDPTPTVVELIDKKNFHEGFRPPNIERPIGDYPNVSTVVNKTAETPESAQYDHQTIYQNVVIVEAMVKAIATEGEEVCNRRAQRLRNALIYVIENNPTFGGVVSGIETGISSQLSTLFVRRENTSYGEPFFWQAVQLEFRVKKEAARNQGSSDSSFVPPYETLGLDQ